MPLFVVLFLLQRLLHGVATVLQVVQLPLNRCLAWQLVAHEKGDEFVAQHAHVRGLVSLQLDR